MDEMGVEGVAIAIAISISILTGPRDALRSVKRRSIYIRLHSLTQSVASLPPRSCKGVDKSAPPTHGNGTADVVIYARGTETVSPSP